MTSVEIPTGSDAPFPTDDEGLPVNREDVERYKVETLAAYCHDQQWSGWMRYLFSKCQHNMDGSITIPDEWATRWGWQMRTPYADLPEKMRESDREEARGLLKLFGEGGDAAPSEK